MPHAPLIGAHGALLGGALLVALAMLAASCRAPEAAPLAVASSFTSAGPAEASVEASAAPAQTRHREAARVILETHCHLCHLPGAEGGADDFRVAGGIATHIFDLRSDDWSATLSDPQLDEAVRKLVEAGARAEEVATLERFVADEHAWRDAHAAHYPRALRERALFAP